MRLLAPTLALVLVTVLPGTARSAQEETAPAPPDLGGPLVVGGIEIPQDEIKRFLIYGPLRAELEYLRIQAWIEHEIERRVRESEAAGEERGERPRSWRRVDFEPDARRVQAHVDSAVSAIEREFPTLDLDTEMRREHRHVDWFERKLRQEVAFDEVFLADDPDRWPSITFEILREEAGEILVDDFRQSYERRVTELEESLAEWREKVAAGGSDAGAEPTLRPEDTFYREILRDIIVDGLAHLAEIETSETGLPPGLVYRLDVDKDGEPELVLKTEEVWDPPQTGSGRERGYSRFNGGAFGKRSWTELRHLMGESDYSLFVNGKLLTDEIFFHSPVGTITGPHRCHWGYCLVLVKERTPPLRPLDLAKEGHRRLLLEDWIRASFIEHAHEALAEVK